MAVGAGSGCAGVLEFAIEGAAETIVVSVTEDEEVVVVVVLLLFNADVAEGVVAVDWLKLEVVVMASWRISCSR